MADPAQSNLPPVLDSEAQKRFAVHAKQVESRLPSAEEEARIKRSLIGRDAAKREMEKKFGSDR
jgi:hypothetical protein